MAPGESLCRSLGSSCLVELLRKLPGHGRIGCHRCHELVAAPKQNLKTAIQNLSRRERQNVIADPKPAQERLVVSRHWKIRACRHRSRERIIEFRRAERRKIIGAATEIRITGITPQGGAKVSRAALVDFIARVEQRLEPRQTRHDPRIADAMRSLLSPGMDDREDRREIEFFPGRGIRDLPAADVNTFVMAPICIEGLGDLLRR